MILDASGQPFDIEEYYRQNFPPGMSKEKRAEMTGALHSAQKKAPRTFSLELRNKAERRYRRLLDEIFRKIEQKTAGLTDPDEVAEALRFFADSPQFGRMCEEAARQMATMLAVGQKADWRAAASASSQGRKIYKLLMEETTNTAVGQTVSNIVAENSLLIKTVPRNMAGKISELARQRRFEGQRPDEILQEIMEQQPHLREFEARRLARTESAKASTALVQARAEAMNLDFYIWRTANDGTRVRESHRIMERVICRWSEPPNPEAMAGERSYGNYHPGGIFNCRCWAQVIVALEDISFPIKAHKGGSITTLTNLDQFKRFYGLQTA